MADYFTHLSFEVELPNEEAVKAAVELLTAIESRLDDPEEADWSGEFERFRQYDEFGFDLVVEVEPDGKTLWIRDNYGSPNVDLLAEYLQLVLQKYAPEHSASFEYATDCTKHRLDAFSGGSLFITADKIDYFSTWEWLSQKRDEWVADRAAAAEGA
jgi:hypothetical protein